MFLFKFDDKKLFLRSTRKRFQPPLAPHERFAFDLTSRLTEPAESRLEIQEVQAPGDEPCFLFEMTKLWSRGSQVKTKLKTTLLGGLGLSWKHLGLCFLTGAVLGEASNPVPDLQSSRAELPGQRFLREKTGICMAPAVWHARLGWIGLRGQHGFGLRFRVNTVSGLGFWCRVSSLGPRFRV